MPARLRPSTARSPRRGARARRRRAARAPGRCAGGRRGRSPRRPRVRARAARRGAPGAPRRSSSASHRSRAPSGGGRAQAQLGQRGPQVEPGSADHDRARAGVEQPVDLGVGQLGVLPGAEARVDGQERDQPVLELRPLVGPGRAGQRSRGPGRPGARRPRPPPGPRRAPAAARASSIATSVLPTPVGPNRAITSVRARPAVSCTRWPAAAGAACERSRSTDPEQPVRPSTTRSRRGPRRRARRPDRRRARRPTWPSCSPAARISSHRRPRSRACTPRYRAARADRLRRRRRARAGPRARAGHGGGGVGGGFERRRRRPRSTPTRSSAMSPSTRSPGLELVSLEASSGVLLLSDPYSFPTDAVLDADRGADRRRVPVLGGIASARTAPATPRCSSATPCATAEPSGSACEGVEMLPCVSQGAAPLGRESRSPPPRATSSTSWPGRPALETLQQIVSELSAARARPGGRRTADRRGDRRRQAGLRAGRLPRARRPGGGVRAPARWCRRPGRGRAGRAPPRARRALGRRGSVPGAQAPRQGARRRATRRRAPCSPATAAAAGMFGMPDHDVVEVERELGGAPTAGFFAAGEIGPVGGRSFLHGFTATLAVFPKSA